MFKSLFSKKNFPWPVILFSLYPVIALLQANLGQIRAADVLRPAGTCLLLGIVIFIFLLLITRNPQKAGIFSAILLIVFFSYGFLYQSLQNASEPFNLLAHHKILLSILVVLLAGIFFWLIRRSTAVHLVHQIILVMGIAAVAIPSFQIAFWLVQNNILPSISKDDHQVLAGVKTGDPNSRPDIYYIILDSYTRQDTMKNGIGYDDSTFLDQLRALGFYVADCAQSNYSQTHLSLTSTLNMTYIHGVIDENGQKGPVLYKSWRKSFQQSMVTETLKSQGYRLMTFESNYPWLTFDGAQMIPLNLNGITPFEGLLMDQSVISAVPDSYLTGIDQDAINKRKYQSIEYVLNRTEQLPADAGPKFVFIHMSVPHPPFVFGPDGQFQTVAGDKSEFDDNYTSADYLQGYKNQSMFISQRIMGVLKALIADSAQLPIIIVQGDHGPSHLTDNDRMNILNAIYLPGASKDVFYPTMSPVNSFRVIFNTYFGEDLSLLPDTAYYTKNASSTKFITLTNTCSTK
jgi:hypothetical protein